MLYSIKSGNWFGDNTWSTTDGGPSCNCDPDGNPVVINASHTVTVNSNSASTCSIAILGVLDIGTTLYHSLGNISGDGLIRVSSTASGIFVIPGGDYDEFLSSQNSTIELFGNNQAVIPSKPGNIYKPFSNLILSGTGRKIIPADDKFLEILQKEMHQRFSAMGFKQSCMQAATGPQQYIVRRFHKEKDKS